MYVYFLSVISVWTRKPFQVTEVKSSDRLSSFFFLTNIFREISFRSFCRRVLESVTIAAIFTEITSERNMEAKKNKKNNT